MSNDLGTIEATRTIPPLGGFSGRILGLELRRLGRNKRAVIFTLVLPSVFFLLFGTAERPGAIPSRRRHLREGRR